MDVSDDKWWSKNTSIGRLQPKTAEEYKYQIAMETAEWNTSKQISAKETALQNVYKEGLIIIIIIIIFFFFEAE